MIADSTDRSTSASGSSSLLASSSDPPRRRRRPPRRRRRRRPSPSESAALGLVLAGGRLRLVGFRLGLGVGLRPRPRLNLRSRPGLGLRVDHGLGSGSVRRREHARHWEHDSTGLSTTSASATTGSIGSGSTAISGSTIAASAMTSSAEASAAGATFLAARLRGARAGGGWSGSADSAFLAAVLRAGRFAAAFLAGGSTEISVGPISFERLHRIGRHGSAAARLPHRGARWAARRPRRPVVRPGDWPPGAGGAAVDSRGWTGVLCRARFRASRLLNSAYALLLVSRSGVGGRAAEATDSDVLRPVLPRSSRAFVTLESCSSRWRDRYFGHRGQTHVAPEPRPVSHTSHAYQVSDQVRRPIRSPHPAFPGSAGSVRAPRAGRIAARFGSFR